MATLEEVLNALDLPVPVEGGEQLDSYARRCAFVGAHAALAWAQVHRPVAIVHVPLPAEGEAQEGESAEESVEQES